MAINVKVNYGTTESDGNGGQLLNADVLTFTTQQYNNGSLQAAPNDINDEQTHIQVRAAVVAALSAGQSYRYIAYTEDKGNPV